MIEKCRILYKGDVLAASFYLLMAVLLGLLSVLLHYFNLGLGFLYLSFGFGAFSLYCLGKGILTTYVSKKRLSYYKEAETLNTTDKNEEISYTEFRIHKKNVNRRLYIYTMIIGSVVAFIGLFTTEKGMIVGTAIPIVLLAGIEFSVGLLTEFRLREYLRILKKDIE
jgi:hypothetical protein